MVPTNVACNVMPPRVPVKGWTIPPPERVQRLISAAAESRTPEMAAMLTLAALTGKGEESCVSSGRTSTGRAEL
jgi:hypothetical protein